MVQPSIILETGVANGTSTSAFLEALSRSGKGTLYSIDPCWLEFLPKGKSTGWLVPNRLRQRWNLIVGTSSEKIQHTLSELDLVDMFLHDSLHTYENMMFELETTWPFIKSGGVVLVDDINQNNAFRDFVKQTKPKKFTKFFHRIGVIIK